MSRSTAVHGALAFVITLVVSASAQAQAFRTYLASTGTDNPACSRPSACRLLPAALAAVASGGEVWMLDSANYNTATVSITKSVTILAIPGAVGSVVTTGGPAIDIPTAGLKVTLRNLVVVPLTGATGNTGITIGVASTLTVEGCLIANLSSFGMVTNGGASLFMTDSTIRDNADTGIWLLGGSKATITRTTLKGNGNGIFVISDGVGLLSKLDIAYSILSGNSNGVTIWSEATMADVMVSIKDSQIVRNANVGVSTNSFNGSNVWVTVSGNIISNNGTGVASNDQGTKVLAFGNTVSGNGTGFVRGTGVFETSGLNTVRNNGTDTVGAFTPVSTM